MYLPTTGNDSSGSFQHISKGSSSSTGGWSSTIGVVTAICGNILISFALNTQRYAHIRLSRDREQNAQQEKRKAGQQKSAHGGYGVVQQQKQIADERAKLNAKSGQNGQASSLNEEEDHIHDNDETAPLIPKTNGRSSSRSSGNTTQEEPDDDTRQDGTAKEKSYLKSPIWWLGIALMVVGEAGNFLAYGFAPASIVSPLGVVALVSNCLIAPLLLGEKFRWRDGFGVLVAIAGCVVVVLSASASNPKLTPDGIWKLITKWQFETYLGITIALIIALAVASTKIGEKSILIDLGLVGLFGGYTALSTKGVASLLSNTVWRVVTFPITYLLVAVLVFTAVMQIKYLNRALQRFNATQVIPTQFVLFTLSVIIGSAVLYQDFEREATADAIKFVCGCALTFFGVWCITSGHGKDPQKDNDGVNEGDGEEEAIDLLDAEHVMPEIRQRDDDAGRRSSTDLNNPPFEPLALRRSITLGSVPKTIIENTDVATSPPSAGLLGLNDISSMQERLSHMTPANASTIRPGATPLLRGETSAEMPPPLHATTSAPIIPTAPSLSASFRPRTPLMRMPSEPNTSSPAKQPSTTPRGNSITYIESGTSTPQPPRLLNRPSVVGLFPGPLTSPLSGSLSAIVADELRRSAGTLRRTLGKSQSRPPVMQSHLFENRIVGRPKRHSIASVDFEAEEAAAELRREAASGSLAVPRSPAIERGGRMRSLSATLGELFGSTTRIARRTDSGNADESNPGARGRAELSTQDESSS